MTELSELRRRPPAGQLRYLAQQIARTNGLDRHDRVRLIAVQMQLEQLADELEPAGTRLAVIRDMGRERAEMAIPDDALEPLLALAEDDVAAPATQASKPR